MTDSPVAIVTGSAQGIGAAICKELLKNGYRICVADIQESKGHEFVKEQQLIYGKGNIIDVHCDVSKESDYKKIFELTLKTYKRVDVLVNNAGIVLEKDPRRCMEVNLLGPIFGCHTALKYMGKSKGGNGGVVINMISFSGFLPCPQMPTYVATKHGLIGLTRSFGLPFHYDKEGITFSSLCPLLVDTEFTKSLNKTLDPTFDFSTFPDELKMSPEFTAKAILKILEEKINGSVLLVSTDGYHYLELEEKLKDLFPSLVKKKLFN